MANNGKNSLTGHRPPELDSATIQKLIEQQARDTELRRLELDLRAQELKHTSAHAEKILGAQERDREAERVHERSKAKYRFLFATFCIGCLICLVIAGMYLDKDQLVGDVLKVLTGAIAGALGGYGYSRIQMTSSADTD